MPEIYQISLVDYQMELALLVLFDYYTDNVLVSSPHPLSVV
ncbi:hypothetical protein Javan85_0007 [Streptococcus phage Javan85]|nr:hypothetical protein Javan85_0007 [Streptococcus phage Javan85]QBX31929.1 hypothetical protein Javan84_0052 [Streptococcus phage Javan84]